MVTIDGLRRPNNNTLDYLLAMYISNQEGVKNDTQIHNFIKSFSKVNNGILTKLRYSIRFDDNLRSCISENSLLQLTHRGTRLLEKYITLDESIKNRYETLQLKFIEYQQGVKEGRLKQIFKEQIFKEQIFKEQKPQPRNPKPVPTSEFDDPEPKISKEKVTKKQKTSSPALYIICTPDLGPVGVTRYSNRSRQVSKDELESNTPHKPLWPNKDDRLVTVEHFKQAIVLATKRDVGIAIDDNSAEKMAKYALGFFGYEHRILDNILTAQDRSLFYQLEEYGLINTEIESSTLINGISWRMHFWCFNLDNLLNTQPETLVDKVDIESSVEDIDQDAIDAYSNLPTNVWSRKKFN